MINNIKIFICLFVIAIANLFSFPENLQSVHIVHSTIFKKNSTTYLYGNDGNSVGVVEVDRSIPIKNGPPTFTLKDPDGSILAIASPSLLSNFYQSTFGSYTVFTLYYEIKDSQGELIGSVMNCYIVSHSSDFRESYSSSFYLFNSKIKRVLDGTTGLLMPGHFFNATKTEDQSSAEQVAYLRTTMYSPWRANATIDNMDYFNEKEINPSHYLMTLVIRSQEISIDDAWKLSSIQ